MISIRNSADLADALNGALNPALRRLLIERRDQLTAGTDADLGELVHIVVAQHGDTRATIEAEIGFPFVPAPFEYVDQHGRWIEAVIITDDDGFAVALFVADCVCTEPELLLRLLAHG